MKIEKLDPIPTRCENGACVNFARYEIFRTDTPTRMRLHLCEDCLAEIVRLGAKIFPPRKNIK